MYNVSVEVCSWSCTCTACSNSQSGVLNCLQLQFVCVGVVMSEDHDVFCVRMGLMNCFYSVVNRPS